MSSPVTSQAQAPVSPWSVGFNSFAISTVLTVALRALIAYTTLVPPALSTFAATPAGTAAVFVGAYILSHIILSIFASCTRPTPTTDPVTVATPEAAQRLPSKGFIPESAQKAFDQIKEDAGATLHNIMTRTPALAKKAHSAFTASLQEVSKISLMSPPAKPARPIKN